MTSRLFLALLGPLLFTACPTRTIYYDAGAGGSDAQAGAAGGQTAGAGGQAGAGPGGSGASGGTAGDSMSGGGMAGAGGHPSQIACDATSCPNGCCTSVGVCVPYASEADNACGTMGSACAACPTGTSCNTAGGICQGCGPAVAITEASLGVPGGGNDQFGASVAIRNGVMLVGAPNAVGGAGRVYAFTGSGSSYSFLQYIAPNGGTASAYAQALGLDSTGTTAVIAGSVGAAGTEWIFTKTGGNWFSGPSLTPPDSFTGLAIDAGTVVVGGPYAAYAYATSGGSAQTLTPSDFTPSDNIGFFRGPVAISGNTVLVSGEPFDTGGQLAHFGYIFVKSGSSWVQQAKLIPNDLLSSNNPHFQFSVALDGTTAVLATTFGAYVFVQTGTSWTQVQKIVPPTDTNSFGTSVDLSGDVMVIGETSSNGLAGAADVFGRSGGAWILGPRLTSGADGDGFGAPVAVNRGTVAVGASGAGPDGAVYLFSCPSTP